MNSQRSPRNHPITDLFAVFVVIGLAVAAAGAVLTTHTTGSRLVTIGAAIAIVSAVAAAIEKVTN